MQYDKHLIDRIGEKLRHAKQTIAVAESVTSGHLQAAFSMAPDASKFFQGGITAYNIGQKCRHLLVEPTHALEYNCVSDKVSADMAVQVCQLFSSDYGAGITGYATPAPEAGVQTLYAHIAIAHGRQLLLSKKIAPAVKDPIDIQIDYVNQLLTELDRLLP